MNTFYQTLFGWLPSEVLPVVLGLIALGFVLIIIKFLKI